MKMLAGLRRRWHARHHADVRRETELGSRRCRFELMEERRVMNADPLHIGVVYTEEDGGSDLHGDTFEVTFTGGAADTELTRLVLSGDKNGVPGYQLGDVFFDTVEGGLGADHAFAFQIISQGAIQSVTATVADGDMTLILDFVGFRAGDKLVFQIDVDEIQEAWPPGSTDYDRINEGIDPITSGVEFQGSTITADFVAPHFQNATGSAEFRNFYDANFAGKNLNLPADNDGGKRDRTAGGVASLTQVPKPITIEGTVFHDQNLDLAQDAGENGIGNVSLALFQKDASGNFVSTGFTTVTDAQGHYRFGENLNLMPGTYQVRETQPSGYFSVGAIPGSVAGASSGSVLSGNVDILTEISIPLGDTHAVKYDFAEAQPASISGYVYADRNNNGLKESGEVGIAGVTMQVIPLNTIAAQSTVTVTTDANGFYEVTGLVPGTYRVVEVNQPAGYYDGLDTPGTVGGVPVGTVTNPGDSLENIFLGGNANGINYNFGELEPGSISGRVHLTDRQGDCFSAEALNRPLGGVTVLLRDGQGNILKRTLTNTNGEYRFDNLAPGTYVIQEITPEGYIDGGDHIGTVAGVKVGVITENDLISSITIAPGDQGVNYDFCEHEPSQLCGNVYHDENNNGLFDAGEDGIAGVTVNLFDDQGNLVATQVTDANGHYCFQELVAGKYRIVEQQPTGWLDNLDTAGTLGGTPLNPGDEIREINVLWGDHGEDYNFGEILPGSLAGVVFADANNNCVREQDEAPIAGVTVKLFDAQGNLVATTTTNAQGEYNFGNLRPGMYTVQESQPAGYLQGGQQAGSKGGDDSQPDIIKAIPIGSGENLVDYNFCEILPATLAGRVYSDPNENCEFDEGDSPLAGVRIDLFNGSGNLVATTYTNAAGQYKFENLRPGEYSVVETQPTGYFNGAARPGTGGGNGSNDPDCGCGEPIGGGVGTADAGNKISQIQIPGGANLTEYNFCELPPAQLSGYVYQDGAAIVAQNGIPPKDLRAVRDGVYTPDDTPLAGVWLELRDGLSGEPIRGEDLLPGLYPPGPVRVLTNAAGYYEFKGLPSGNYAVYQTQPEGYFDGIDHAGTTLGIAVNPDSGLDPAFLSTFADLPANDAIVRIPLGAGQHSELNNFSEVKVARFYIPPPVNPPLPPPVIPPPLIFPQNVATPLPPNFLAPPTPLGVDGGGMPAYTWHLSIIDAGAPRGDFAIVDGAMVFRNASFLVDRQDWVGVALDEGRWQLKGMRGEDDGPEEDEPLFGLVGGIPVMGDFNGDGLVEKGIYFQGEWFIDLNGNGRWDDEDLWAKLGTANDLPVVGDWDGDGKDDIGIFGPEWPGDPEAIENEPGLPDPENLRQLHHIPKNVPPLPGDATLGHRLLKHTASGKARADLIDHVFRYGDGQDLPVSGDWNGDGIDNIGIFRDGQWFLDTDGDGRWTSNDVKVTFGQKGDLPVVGDWNGDGIDQLGVYRSGTWILDTNNNHAIDAADKVFEMGGPDDLPVVGDFDGNGIDDPGLYTDVAAPQVRQARRAG
jgi:protocatechuate 3,4-dioxygenase beta subunit